MSLQENILQRQNDHTMLRFQYAARKYFNLAEIFGNVALGASLASVFLILLPELSNENVSLFAPIVLDIVALGSYTIMGCCVSCGADIRNYFDQFVLDIDSEKYSREYKIKLRNKVDIITKLFKRECLEQIDNTGHDYPPGVKDWYEFSREYRDSDVVFECQKINARWDKELTAKRLKIQFTVILVVILIVSGACILYNVSVWKIIACIISAAITFFDRIKENIVYIKQSEKISGRIEALEISKNKVHIKELQKMIGNRRKIRVVGINRLHKQNSKRMSDQDVMIQ